MNVLSLFDGISCGRVALERAELPVDNYFASEIDKHAIKVSKDNWPSIVQIGDVTKVKYLDGKLYGENAIIFEGKIDLLIGGSPCQDFSPARATGMHGKSFDGLKGEKSGLFYEYLRILNEIKEENPKVIWLLENVKMKKESKKQLDDYLGVEGIFINSNLLSFQSRPRFYWSNIKFGIPQDKGISFQDYKQITDLSQYKVPRTSSRERMWNNGEGQNNSGSCANVTNSKKVYCLTTKQDRCPNSGLVEYEDFCRFLSRSELEHAQTVPVNYTKAISYNQAQVVLGNGWTVDVIVHILKHVDKELFIDNCSK